MSIDDLRSELQANNIDERACLIRPTVPIEGALCLLMDDDGRWRVVLNERGEYLINETLQSEHEACRFFLKLALLNPTNRKNFTQATLKDWPVHARALLVKYGFEESE